MLLVGDPARTQDPEKAYRQRDLCEAIRVMSSLSNSSRNLTLRNPRNARLTPAIVLPSISTLVHPSLPVVQHTL